MTSVAGAKFGFARRNLKKNKSKNSVFPNFSKFCRQISTKFGGLQEHPGRTTVQNFGERIFPKMFLIWGQKNFFEGGPTPNAEVELGAEVGGFCRARGGV